MTISAVLGGDDYFDFATTKGLGDFIVWVDSLDINLFPTLSHLADWGWVNDLSVLESEIKFAIDISLPIFSLGKTIEEFLANLSGRKSTAETIMFTNGLSPAEEPAGEWWIDGKPV